MFSNKWNESKVDVFWGEIAPCEHVVQIYDSEHVFMDLLTEFVADGIRRDESVIVIATQEHLHLLEERLRVLEYDLFNLKLFDKLIFEDAQATLSKFIIGEWPDEILFRHVIGGVLSRASKNKRPVRAFGEMVVLLWAKGLHNATLQLERLWNDMQETESFSLYCAYPRSVFSGNGSESIINICGVHSKIVAPIDRATTKVVYKDLSFTRKS
jgi:hypothetical protein